jgi:8-oxo-dGTP diphosphatase
MSATPPHLIRVAAGAIGDARGRILLARRPDHSHQGGLWEFPGGKLEPGESVAAGLARELREELGIAVQASEPLIRIHHDYGDRQVLLDVHRVSAFTGEPRGREGQPLCWQHPAAMDPDAFPAADRPVILALRLPDRMLITGAGAGRPAGFLARLERALGHGLRLVQLRTPELAPAAFRSLAAAVLERCRDAGAALVINPPPGWPGPELAALPEAAGLHLNGRRLWQLEQRPLAGSRLVGCSCHTAEDLARAARLGLDYALLSPVLPTTSHPDATPLGWAGFSALTGPATLPVYALGGLTGDDLETARRHGGQGIAAIRGLWPGP